MNTIEWKVSDILEGKLYGLTVSGNPKIIDSSYGKVVSFNGIDDALFLEINPITGLAQFTIEAIFHPDPDGSFEQRFLHFGHSQDDRLLFETRTEENQWYFDAFVATGQTSQVLIDKEKKHPVDKWHHTAFVIDNRNLASYVNGVKELTGKVELTPIQGGKTSIGARQNKISWYKGSIYSIKITPRALTAEEFSK